MEGLEDATFPLSDAFYAQLCAHESPYGDLITPDEGDGCFSQPYPLHASVPPDLEYDPATPTPPSLRDTGSLGDASLHTPASSTTLQQLLVYDRGTFPQVPLPSQHFGTLDQRNDGQQRNTFVETQGLNNDVIRLQAPRNSNIGSASELSRETWSDFLAIVPENTSKHGSWNELALDAKNELLLQQPISHGNDRLSIERLDSEPFDAQVLNGTIDHQDNHSMVNQWQTPCYSGSRCTLPAFYNDSKEGMFDSTTNTMSSYPPVPDAMSLMPTGIRLPEEQGQDLPSIDNDFKFYNNDPSLLHSNANSVFFGFVSNVDPQSNTFDFISDPLTEPHTFQTPKQQNDIPYTPLGDVSVGGSGRRDTSKDQKLLELRNMGYSYREIKQNYGFEEAESTLRGRYRTLTKAKEERVRKPEWKVDDISLLCNTVQDQTIDAGAVSASGFRYSADGLPILFEQVNLNKVSWKKVAEMMADQGAYHYGNATVKKKYVQVRNEKLFGVAAANAQYQNAIAIAGANAGVGSGMHAVSNGYDFVEGYGDPFGNN